jgi:hypothetical protein
VFQAALAAFVLIGLVAFWVVYDFAWQNRVRRLFYGETGQVHPGGGRWVESPSAVGPQTAILRRHQRVGLLLAVLVLADLGYSFELFRYQYITLRAVWRAAGPNLIRVAAPESARYPKKLWSATFGGHAQVLAMRTGFVLVRDYDLENCGLYLIDRSGRLTWTWEPDDGFIGAVAAGGDQAGEQIIAAWGRNGLCRVFRLGPDGAGTAEGVQENPPPMVNQRVLGPPMHPANPGTVTDEDGRYRVTASLPWSSSLGWPITTVVLCDDGP